MKKYEVIIYDGWGVTIQVTKRTKREVLDTISKYPGKKYIIKEIKE